MALLELHEIDPRKIDQPNCLEFLDYWTCRKTGSGPPRRKDLDPLLDTPHLAPHLVIWDVLAGGMSFRIRLAGTATAELHGSDPTGMHLNPTWTGPQWQALLLVLRKCVETGRPCACEGTYCARSGPWRDWQAIMLPVTGGKIAVEQIMVCICPHHPAAPCGG